MRNKARCADKEKITRQRMRRREWDEGWEKENETKDAEKRIRQGRGGENETKDKRKGEEKIIR